MSGATPLFSQSLDPFSPYLILRALALFAAALFLFFLKLARACLMLGYLVGTLFSLLVARWVGVLQTGEYLFTLLSGGFLAGAVFYITDPVSAPATVLGAFVFAFLAAVLGAMIRLGTPLFDGVAYGILMANFFAPLLDKNLPPPRRSSPLPIP